jgi:hypothetical protein
VSSLCFELPTYVVQVICRLRTALVGLVHCLGMSSSIGERCVNCCCVPHTYGRHAVHITQVACIQLGFLQQCQRFNCRMYSTSATEIPPKGLAHYEST